jgi:Kdo2-lipid IVA lauroyltransferase/acyltransferase
VPGRPTLRARVVRWLQRVADAAMAAPVRLCKKVLPAIPSHVAIGFADVLGFITYALDRRGRRAGHQNLAVVYGDEMPAFERRRILRACYRNALRNEVLLFHLQPMTPTKWHRYAHVTPEDEARFRAMKAVAPVYVAAAPHLGNWELLLASNRVLPYATPADFLMETVGWPSVDAIIADLRAFECGTAAWRKGGATTMRAALDVGRCASMLVDRNTPRRYGGVWVPFLGLPARTTPLPARLAAWYGVPLLVAMMIPDGPLRWRLWISGDLMEPRSGDEEADVAAGLARMNDVISRVIREHPESWCWMQKRWKGRPTPELGPYPQYSLFDPD